MAFSAAFAVNLGCIPVRQNAVHHLSPYPVRAIAPTAVSIGLITWAEVTGRQLDVYANLALRPTKIASQSSSFESIQRSHSRVDSRRELHDIDCYGDHKMNNDIGSRNFKHPAPHQCGQHRHSHDGDVRHGMPMEALLNFLIRKRQGQKNCNPNWCHSKNYPPQRRKRETDTWPCQNTCLHGQNQQCCINDQPLTKRQTKTNKLHNTPGIKIFTSYVRLQSFQNW